MLPRTGIPSLGLTALSSLIVLSLVAAAGSPAAWAGLLPIGWGSGVSTAEGVVHVWSEFPPGGRSVFVYPGWGYRFHPDYTIVDCDVDPEEALVVLDGEVLGEADDFDGFPSYLFIRPGHHVLEFRAPGRRPLVMRGSFRSGAFIRVDRELEHGGEPQYVPLDDPVDVSGLEPPGYTPPELPPDDGPAGVVPPAAAADEQGGQAVIPPEGAGFLRLQVSPADAAVYIDDRFFGSGDEISRLHGFIRLAPGPHTIEVTRPGYAPKSLPLEIVHGEKQHLDVWLEKTDAGAP